MVYYIIICIYVLTHIDIYICIRLFEILKCGVKHDRNTFVSGRHLTVSGSKPALGRLGRFGAVMDNLERSGWDEVALAGIADLDWEEQKRILRPVTGPMSFGDELQLKARIAGADVRQRLDNTSFARMPVGYFVDTHWARRYGAEAETPLAPLLEWERVKRNAPVTRWPTRFQRTLDGVEDKVFRSELEAKERGKVVRRLADFLAVTGLWRPEESGGSREGAELAQQRFAMGRRLGTLRQHLRNATQRRYPDSALPPTTADGWRSRGTSTTSSPHGCRSRAAGMYHGRCWHRSASLSKLLRWMKGHGCLETRGCGTFFGRWRAQPDGKRGGSQRRPPHIRWWWCWPWKTLSCAKKRRVTLGGMRGWSWWSFGRRYAGTMCRGCRGYQTQPWLWGLMAPWSARSQGPRRLE